MKKKFNNDIIFLIGIFLLPFENFFFAPSFGWATVTPIIFAIYIPIGRKVFCIFAKNVSTWEDNLCGTMITGLYSFSFI